LLLRHEPLAQIRIGRYPGRDRGGLVFDSLLGAGEIADSTKEGV
jgi:hypothetical protein